MFDKKTRDELIIELKELREQISKSARLENERKRAEEALKESQQMLQLVMDSIPQAIFWKDTNSVYLGCNKVLAHDVGLKDPGEIIGKTDYDLPTTREQSESYREYDRRVMSTDKPIYHIIEEQHRPDDTIACLDTNKIPLHDSNGNVIGVLCTYEDITERKRAEVALKESEEKYRLIVETTNQGICIIDAGMGITFVNKRLAGMMGYSPEEMIGRSVWDFMDESGRVISLEKMEELRQGISKSFEIKATRKDCTPIWVIINAVSRYDKDGKFAGSLAMLTDITERKRAEEALTDSQQMLQLIMDNIPQAVFWKDRNSVYIGCNKVFAVATGLGTPENIRGKTDYDMPWSREQADLFRECDRRIMENDRPEYHINEQQRESGGRTAWLETNKVPLHDAKGNVTGILCTYEDITERKRADEALHEKEVKYRIVADNTYDWEFWLSPDGQILYTSPSCERITGHMAGEFIKNPGLLFDITYPEDRPALEAHKHLPQSSSHCELEFRIIAKNGEIRWIHHLCQPVFDENGCFIGTRGSNRDITKRKLAEEALRKNEQMLKQSQGIAHLGSWELDLVTNALSWSDEVYRIFGLQPQEFGATYEAFLEAVHPDDRTAVDNAYWGSIHEGRDTYEIEHRVVRRSNGEVRIVHEKCEHFRDASGRIIRSVGMIHDITERKRADEEVRLAYAYNRSLIEASLDPLVTIAPDGKITDVNLATETVTGYPRDKLVGTDFSNYFTNPEKAKEGYLKVLREGSVKDYPLEIRHCNGHITPVIYNAAIYRDDRGEVIGIFAAARDITERKRVEDALEEAKNQVEIYLDLMGHDINNLNQVGIGYLELALETLDLDQKGRELIAKPLEALENSSKLIDKVRKIQQVKTGERKLYEVDVARLLRDLIPKYTNISGREVTINYVSGCHCSVMANDLLADVFLNILGNAVKHSSGPLTINVRVSKVESVDQAYCKVTIEDNGPGIPDNVKKKLFSRFQRGHTKASGQGLGLFLVRSLVQYYHGYVWIEDSVPGDHTKGTRFVVMLRVIEDATLYDKFNKKKSL